jgi:hypothetical protein
MDSNWLKPEANVSKNAQLANIGLQMNLNAKIAVKIVNFAGIATHVSNVQMDSI